ALSRAARLSVGGIRRPLASRESYRRRSDSNLHRPRIPRWPRIDSRDAALLTQRTDRRILGSGLRRGADRRRGLAEFRDLLAGAVVHPDGRVREARPLTARLHEARK